MTTQAAEQRPLTLAEIDEVLTHWANKLHVDPDPLNRWASLTTIDRWLDARLRLEELRHGEEED